MIINPTYLQEGEFSQADRAVRLAALHVGEFSTAVDQFDDDFKFTDHALGREFTDKMRLIEFFTKSGELFPDTLVRADAIFESGDNVIVEWTLSSTGLSPGSFSNSNFFARCVDRPCWDWESQGVVPLL